MRKLSLLLLLLSFFTISYAQIIKGTILDKNTGSPIYFATIYISGTFVGTNSDLTGNFKLDISKNSSMPIIISSLGYYSASLSNYSPNKLYLIYLEPKIFELKEVVITAKANAFERKINLNIFKKEFLGATLNAMSCQITNEDDIILTYNPVTDTLKAFSSNPILINNKALGYNIIYYLDKFEFCWSKSYLLITGNYIFKEDSTNINSQLTRYERKRKSAYLGSRMHFFRALWENNLDSAGFTVKDSANVRLSYDKYVIQIDSIIGSDHLKCLKYHGILFVAYHSKLPQSRIVMLKDNIYFYKDGFFDPLGIGWQGEMAKQRIADLLPFEYSIKQSNR